MLPFHSLARLANYAKVSVAPAKILDMKASYQVSGKIQVTEHWFEVPKDYAEPEAGKIKLFARSARRHEGYPNKTKSDAPWMVFLQGGPGYECRAPQHNTWTETIINRGYQMLFLDQRGTGLSTPVTADTLIKQGDHYAQQDYLRLHRADNIVRDCEAIRKALLPHKSEYHEQKWSVMGQSFGGFCCITYLSFFPQGLQEVFIYGGLQPLVNGPKEVYRRLYRKVIERNEAYYAKYPEDVQRVKRIWCYIKMRPEGRVTLPSQGWLTVQRFQQLGLLLGFHGGLDTLHEIVLRAANDLELFGHLSHRSLREIDDNTDFDNAILYSILHEPIYCTNESPWWSAEEVRKEFPQFSDKLTTSPGYFTGEMIYRFMYTDYAELRKVEQVAELIAGDTHWPPLFDKEQLAKNTVPVFAAVYEDDMYVDVAFSLETAKAIKGTKVYRSNVMLHNAVRAKTEEVVNALFKLRDDVSD